MEENINSLISKKDERFVPMIKGKSRDSDYKDAFNAIRQFHELRAWIGLDVTSDKSKAQIMTDLFGERPQRITSRSTSKG